MSTRRQTLICSLSGIAIALLGVLVLEVGRAKTLSDSPGGAKPIERIDSGLLTLLPQKSHPAFTLSTSRTATGGDGGARLLSTLQRFQRADGAFKLVSTHYTPEGAIQRTLTHFGIIGLGVFRLDESSKRLIFTGPQVDAPPGDVEQLLREDPLFNRDESLAGVKSVVWRMDGRSEGDFVEEYRAPSLGGLLIKTVRVSACCREVDEPTAIQMGEPSSSLFAELLSYPVDYSHYERRALETDGRNEPADAHLMRDLMQHVRQRPSAGFED